MFENHAELRAELEASGQMFTSDTDSEIIAKVLDIHLQRGLSSVAAVEAVLPRLDGSYALARIFAGYPELMIGAQRGAPLAIGFGHDEMFLASMKSDCHV